MVVSFPPAGPADESSETLAPVTSLFGRRPATESAPDADGWFVGQPEEPSMPEGEESSLGRPVAPLRRRTADEVVERDAVQGRTPAASSPADPRPPAPAVRSVSWTSDTDTEAPDDDTVEEAAPVDPEVRLAELDLLAVRRLARRGSSEWEIAELLRGHEAEPDEVEHVLSELRRRGYLDDAELARQLVESLHTRKGQSRAVIGRELSSRRIDPSIAAEALEAIDDDDELRRALIVAEKRAGQLRSLDQATAERRLSAYLARRGYGSAIIREACSRALSGSKRSGVSFR